MYVINPDRFYPIYRAAPVPIQHLAATITGYSFRRSRYGRVFRSRLESLMQTQSWPVERLKAIQNERLRHIVQIAYEHVPFYRNRFDTLGLDYRDIRTTDDLRYLPILSKEEVRLNQQQLLNRTVTARQLIHDHTSGSTGTSLQLVYTDDALQEQNAVWARHRAQFGELSEVRQATFLGRSIVPITHNQPPFWRYNLASRQTLFSIYHMSPANFPYYFEHLQTHRYGYFNGYPSALELLADAMLDAKVRLPYTPKCALTSAESLSDAQRSKISEALQCPVSDHYGLAEMVGSACRCDAGLYHEDMEFCVHEYLPVEHAPDTFRLVGTSLANIAMPLIRYETGDLVVPAGACTCGRPAPTVQSFDGRRESLVTLPNGAKVGRLDHVFKDCQAIREAQIIQTTVDSLTVKIVRRSGYGEADEAFLLGQLRMRVGYDIRLMLQYVTEVPRGPSGKMRAVISTVRECPPVTGVAS